MKVLVINCGSSSLKYQLIELDNNQLMARGLADRVGLQLYEKASLTHRVNEKVWKYNVDMPDHYRAMEEVAKVLTHPEMGVIKTLEEIDAVGHRVVHGGERFTSSVVIDKEVEKAIEECANLAPLHNPPNLTGIRAAKALLPNVPHIAVFDTAFHSTIPPYAYIYALPYEFYERYRIRRYGFHGTSHYYVARRAIQYLKENFSIEPSKSKVITCHLGNGCSITAVLGGESIDTSMGLTPAEGLVMGTRCGDIDPAILPFLMEKEGYTAKDIDEIINKKSGLLGISGKTNDMRDIEEEIAKGDKRAKLAFDVFCYRVKKYIGAYAAVMGGVHAVVFTGGIGENGPMEREAICSGLEFLGIEIDPEKNEMMIRGKEGDISKENAPTRVLVIPTNEELVIAQETARIVSNIKKRSV
ncbi:acetate kinase [bacterium]|nr:acetate kinase [bacterium]